MTAKEGPNSDTYWTLASLGGVFRFADSPQTFQVLIDKLHNFRRIDDSVKFSTLSIFEPYLIPSIASNMTITTPDFTVGVLALQGAFSEHIQLLRQAAKELKQRQDINVRWEFIEVRTPQELAQCEGLIIPGGESTTMSLVAARSGILEPLREFVK